MDEMCFLVFLFVIAVVSSVNKITLHSRLGSIKGVTKTLHINNSTHEYSRFTNVPFAKPPVGELRFKEPVPFGKWNGILDATEFGPSCIQRPRNNPSIDRLVPNMNQSEDCLLLNIYVPANTSASNRKSVMVWLYGGGFVIGQGMLYNSSYLSVVGDVIVVTINYRLGAFGFFSTNDENSPGNYGLLDQKLAIQWVHDNIDSFGGDPKSVTIFGESSGSFSVSFQAIHPENQGLFQRVIAQSGTANSLMAISTVPRKSAKNFARLLNCSLGLREETMGCLRNKTANELLYAYQHMPSLAPDKYHFLSGIGPVVDHKFIKDNPQTILNGKSAASDFYKSLDVIIGNCEAEGTLLVSELSRYHDVKTGMSSDYLCDIIISPLSRDFFKDNTYIVPAMCNKYKSNGTMVEQSRLSVDFYGDMFFYSPTIQSLNAHATGSGSQYQYLSKRRSVWSMKLKTAPWLPESGHASEIPFLFPMNPLTNAAADDKKVTMTMMKYWSNFAKSGNVNGPGVPNWPEYDVTTQKYAEIDVNVTIAEKLYKNRMDFWIRDVPKLLRRAGLQHIFGK